MTVLFMWFWFFIALISFFAVAYSAVIIDDLKTRVKELEDYVEAMNKRRDLEGAEVKESKASVRSILDLEKDYSRK